MADARNRSRGRAMKQLTALFMRGQGLDVQWLPRSRTTRISERISEEFQNRPDLTGGALEGLWWLDIGADVQQRWGSRVDAAQSAAALAGWPYSAAIQHRRDHEIADAVVLMSLAQFTKLIKEHGHE
jgi:hypothetical protein